MMRKALQAVPLETGNRWAAYALACIAGTFIGWVAHPTTCWLLLAV